MKFGGSGLDYPSTSQKRRASGECTAFRGGIYLLKVIVHCAGIYI